MSEESDDQEKTEPATHRRLEKAREEGQVARSRELTTFLLLGGGLLGLWAMGSKLSRELGMVMEQAFLFDRTQAFDLHVTMSHVFELGSHGLLAIAPLLLGLVVLALVSPLLLGGWSMSSKAMASKFSNGRPGGSITPWHCRQDRCSRCCSSRSRTVFGVSPAF